MRTYKFPYKSKFKPKSIFIILSDVNASPQLLSIMKYLKVENCRFQVVLIADYQIKLADDMASEGIAFRQLSHTSKYFSFKLFWRVFLRLVCNRPDMVYASGQFASAIGMICSFFLRVPTRVFTRHHSHYHYEYNMRFGIFVDRLTNKMATHIVAVSSLVKDILITMDKVPKEKISIIFNGINLQEFLRMRLISKKRIFLAGDRREALQVGMIARMTDWKGVEYGAMAFVEFVKAYPNANLTIVGAFSDSYTNIYNILKVLPSEKYSLKESYNNIPEFLSKLDIFIHVPIGPKDEAFGIVYVEALSVGAPSVFTISGILHELPDVNKYAEIVPYKDAKAILVSMLKLASQSSPDNYLLPETLLQVFSIDYMCRQYAKFIRLGEN